METKTTNPSHISDFENDPGQPSVHQNLKKIIRLSMVGWDFVVVVVVVHANHETFWQYFIP